MNQTSYDSINEPLGAEDFDMRRFFFLWPSKDFGWRSHIKDFMGEQQAETETVVVFCASK